MKKVIVCVVFAFLAACATANQPPPSSPVPRSAQYPDRQTDEEEVKKKDGYQAERKLKDILIKTPWEALFIK